MSSKDDSILLVGAGSMAVEYAKVLRTMKIQFFTVGRSQKSANNFKIKTGLTAISGGLDLWLKKNTPPHTAIVAVSEDQLGNTTRQLIQSGCNKILVEKPGGLDELDIQNVAALAAKKKANVYVGYNRRFYTSTHKAMSIIKKDGLKSFWFDFTERSYVIEKLPQSKIIKKQWFLHNSTHVIDLAFFLAGWPNTIHTYKTGKLSWHPSGSIYVGHGLTAGDIPFAYHANWQSAGRWGIEIMTPKNRLIFRPLEKLQIQKYGSMEIENYPLIDDLDCQFKPGLYLQVKEFLGNNIRYLPTIQEQVKNLNYYGNIQKIF